MKLAPRLMLVGLVTLALPWAGCQYLREVEASLRASQAQTLSAGASAVAGALDAKLVGAQLEPGRFAAGRTKAQDLYAHRLEASPRVDGFVDDWNLPQAAMARMEAPGLSVRYAAGERADSLYLFFAVSDGAVVYGGPGEADGVRLALVDNEGIRRDLVFATLAPGEFQPVTPDGRTVRRARANWQPTSSGYNLEIALPTGMASARAGFTVTDVGGGSAPVSIGSLPDLASAPGWLIHRSSEAESALARSAPPGARLRLIDRLGFVLADTGEGADDPEDVGPGLLTRLIKMAVGAPGDLPTPPGESPGHIDIEPYRGALGGSPVDVRFRQGGTDRITVASARSLLVTPPAAAMLIAEQDTAPILSVTDQAARRLVISSLAASLVAVAALLGFAAWLSWRIRRLSAATTKALGVRGEILPDLPEANSGDEIGELSRSFSRLLSQVGEYNAYLQTLGQKLTHELRTPMTVVRTSLENLESDPDEEQATRYLKRARQGIERLQAMMTALGAATRVEHAITTAESEAFDLRALVREMASAYAAAHASRTITHETPTSACHFTGSPDLIAQMMDKLVENALDFCPHDGRIDIRLTARPGSFILAVANSGSRLPDPADRLFDSLVTARPDAADASDGAHLGLGLHIARLIARHHGGSISAHNLPDSKGVEFRVELPTEPRRAI